MKNKKAKPKPLWKPGNLRKLTQGKILTALTVDELLTIVSTLWPSSPKASLTCYSFTLGKFPYGWRFSVVNSWDSWTRKGFKYQFGAYRRPEYAIAAFLQYCLDNKIQPHKLIEK